MSIPFVCEEGCVCTTPVRSVFSKFGASPRKIRYINNVKVSEADYRASLHLTHDFGKTRYSKPRVVRLCERNQKNYTSRVYDIDEFNYKNTNHGVLDRFVTRDGWTSRRYQPRTLFDLAFRKCTDEEIKYVYSNFAINKPEPVVSRRLFSGY